jgi:3-isopropylmalate/(R)-2-methylmalate dehydratase small subunit
MTGRAHVYTRVHINTDEIIPARYLTTDKEEELAKHAMEDLDIEFVKKVKKGDFIIAGEDFGCGSSREHAVWALRGSGIKAIIAESFARIFYRNCINNGFFAIECEGITKNTSSGDKIDIDFKNGIIENLTKEDVYKFSPIPEFAREMIEVGGLMNYIKRKKCMK